MGSTNAFFDEVWAYIGRVKAGSRQGQGADCDKQSLVRKAAPIIWRQARRKRFRVEKDTKRENLRCPFSFIEEGGVMAARLTDKQKKLIVADYVEIGSYNAVAKKHGVSVTTVIRVCENEETKQKVIEKKEENSADILAYMETKRDKVAEIIGLYLDRLSDPELINKSNASQLTTALGTLIDKFTMQGVKQAGTTREDDPLTKALKECARELENGDQ